MNENLIIENSQTELHHHLFDDATGKIWAIHRTGNKIVLESGKPGKTKTTEKEPATADAADKEFEKKEWYTLKKGYVLRDGHALPGHPVLHYFVGSGYTGALSFANTPKGIYVYKPGLGSAKEDKDHLVRLSEKGVLEETIELPKVLPWDIIYLAAEEALLMDVDHYIFSFSLGSGVFTQLTHQFDKPASFVAAGGKKIAYASHPKFYIRQWASGTVLEQEVQTELVNGSIHFCAALSKGGSAMALYNMPEQVQLLDSNNGSLIRAIPVGPGKVEQMEFVSNDQLLLIRVLYTGAWEVRFFDIKNASEVNFPGLIPPSYSKEVSYFCFNADQSKLVYLQRKKVFVFDFVNKQLLHSFQLAHIVKSAKAGFVGDLLGVRTDYGCFSLYRV
jgi:predicted DNA-binding WGR domain protein